MLGSALFLKVQTMLEYRGIFLQVWLNVRKGIDSSIIHRTTESYNSIFLSYVDLRISLRDGAFLMGATFKDTYMQMIGERIRTRYSRHIVRFFLCKA